MLVTMSDKELSRVNVIQAVCERRLKRRDAASQLKLTIRSTLAFKYGHRSLSYQIFDKLDSIDQGKIVDNKRLGTVLKLAQDKIDELERQDKHSRSKSMPKRRAQARIQEQLRAVDPVLNNSKEFSESLRK